MTTTTFDKYPLYIVEPGEEYEPEPFSYAIRITLKGKKYKFTAICNDIPCQICPVAEACNKGKHRVKALTYNFKGTFPEYFI